MVKEKEGSTETTTPKKRKSKPETLKKRETLKRFKAWMTLTGGFPKMGREDALMAAFTAGTQIGGNNG